MMTASATPATMQNSQSGKYAPSTPIDGAFTHPDIRIAAIAAVPIARLEHLSLAIGMCRVKVVLVARSMSHLAETPMRTASNFGFFGPRRKPAREYRFY